LEGSFWENQVFIVLGGAVDWSKTSGILKCGAVDWSKASGITSLTIPLVLLSETGYRTFAGSSTANVRGAVAQLGKWCLIHEQIIEIFEIKS